MWARDPEGAGKFRAPHYRTGGSQCPWKPLLHKVLAAQKFDQGYATTEYLAAALIDQAWHQLALQQDAGSTPRIRPASRPLVLQRHGIDSTLVPPRYHTSYFSHVFSGGYSAGYYAYIWSEVLARDAGSGSSASTGGLRRANGDTLRTKVLSRGRSRDPQAMCSSTFTAGRRRTPLVAYRGL